MSPCPAAMHSWPSVWKKVMAMFCASCTLHRKAHAAYFHSCQRGDMLLMSPFAPCSCEKPCDPAVLLTATVIGGDVCEVVTTCNSHWIQGAPHYKEAFSGSGHVALSGEKNKLHWKWRWLGCTAVARENREVVGMAKGRSGGMMWGEKEEQWAQPVLPV